MNKRTLALASLLILCLVGAVVAQTRLRRGVASVSIDDSNNVVVAPGPSSTVKLQKSTAVTGGLTVSTTLAVTGASTLTGGATIGSTGTALTRVAKYTASLTPAEVAANTCAEQTFTVTGIHASDTVVVNKPTAQAGLGIAGVRASATNTVGINFCNATGSPITPTAAQTYLFIAIR